MAIVNNLIANKLHPATGEDLRPTVQEFWRDGITPMSDSLCGGLFNKDTEPTSDTFGSYFKWNSAGPYPLSRLTTANHSNFVKLLNDFGDAPQTIVLNKKILITSDATIPSNFTLQFEPGGGFDISDDVELTIDGYVNAGDYQIFYGNSIPVFRARIVSPEWFGLIADYDFSSNSGTDNTAALQKAVDFLIKNGGGTVRLPIGKMLVNGTIYINPSVSVPIAIVGSTFQHKQLDNTTGSTIFRSVGGAIFRTNTKQDGSPFLPVPEGYTGFAALNFSIRSRTSGVIGFDMFRTRSVIDLISARGCEYLIYQPDTATGGAANYCDISRYDRLTVNESTLHGVKLVGADNSTVGSIACEAPSSTFRNLLEISSTRGMIIQNVLFWSATEFSPVLNSRLISLSVCSSISIHSLHIERCFTDKVVWVNAGRSISLGEVDLTFVHNDVFHFQNNTKEVNIFSYKSNATKNAGKYDIVVAIGSSIENIRVYSYILENTSLVRRPIDIQNTSTSVDPVIFAQFSPNVGVRPLVSEDTVSDYNSITGERFFIAPTTAANLPVSGQLGVGFQLLLDGNPLFKRQLVNCNGDWHKRASTNGTFGAWVKILDANSDVSESKIAAVYSVTTDANYTISSAGTVTQLQAITANRTLTLPDATLFAGKHLIILNRNSSSFSWNVASPFFRGTDGANITSVTSNTTTILVSDGAVWRVIADADSNKFPVYTTNGNTGSPPTKAQLNSAYGSQKAGSIVTYPSLSAGGHTFRKLTDDSLSDWVDTVWSTGLSSLAT